LAPRPMSLKASLDKLVELDRLLGQTKGTLMLFGPSGSTLSHYAARRGLRFTSVDYPVSRTARLRDDGHLSAFGHEHFAAKLVPIVEASMAQGP
jgi:hypothetical protein